jgi:hypothetical protein
MPESGHGRGGGPDGGRVGLIRRTGRDVPRCGFRAEGERRRSRRWWRATTLPPGDSVPVSWRGVIRCPDQVTGAFGGTRVSGEEAAERGSGLLTGTTRPQTRERAGRCAARTWRTPRLPFRPGNGVPAKPTLCLSGRRLEGDRRSDEGKGGNDPDSPSEPALGGCDHTGKWLDRGDKVLGCEQELQYLVG